MSSKLAMMILALALAACGTESNEPPATDSAPEGIAETEAVETAVEADLVKVPADEPVDGYVIVDGEEMPLAEIRCAAVGGGSTWRVAASFDIIPEGRDRPGRYYFDVRSIVDEDGRAAPRTRTGQPDVTLQFPRDDGPTPDAFLFFTADSRFRGGNTLELDFSTAGSSGTIDVQRQYVRAHEVSEEGPEPELKTVEYRLNCP